MVCWLRLVWDSRNGFFDEVVMPHVTVEVDERSDRAWFDDGLLDVHPGKRADRVHGPPSRQDQKFDLVIEMATTKLRADKSRHMAQLGYDFLAEMLRIRFCFR
jgi:hypothetical protein